MIKGYRSSMRERAKLYKIAIFVFISTFTMYTVGVCSSAGETHQRSGLRFAYNFTDLNK